MAASALVPRSHRKIAAADPVESAALAKLQYVAETGPGISRKRAGAGFRYVDSAGKPIRGKKDLARIAALAIPPEWTSVWICPNPNGHIQAVGRDAKGRKQYRYHARYRQIRDRVKFHRLTEFCAVLPRSQACRARR
jgi:DNA topoisomerase I